MSEQAGGIRAANRARLEGEILRLGREHLAQVGPAALSLRAIARDLGMASSAVYRYVASRDELLTLLIIESYDAMADAVEAALAGVDDADLRDRWFTVGRALRAWAIANPHDWALLYGSPVPGYAAPPDRTTDPGTRIQVTLIDLIRDIVRLRRVAPESRRPEASAAALAVAEGIGAELGMSPEELPPALLLAGLCAWTLLTASVSNEVFEQLGELGGAYATLHEHVLEVALRPLLR
ncbi:MAG: TetR/AcrR family transcriptional regulator [Phycicoccus sp.]|nr:TetR/AcrR family transcriptional regulator [Phycicoccus sp.]